jgi:hypothetical protein
MSTQQQHSPDERGPGFNSPAQRTPDPPTPAQHSAAQHSAAQRTPAQRTPDQHTPAQHTPHAHESPRRARHRADVEVPTEATALPAWGEEVPERGYYDPEVRSPEWVRARGLGLVADLPEATAERPEDRIGTSIERGRVFPTTYRETFVFSA